VWVEQVLSSGSHKANIKETGGLGLIWSMRVPFEHIQVVGGIPVSGIVGLRLLLSSWFSTGQHSQLPKPTHHAQPPGLLYNRSASFFKAVGVFVTA